MEKNRKLEIEALVEFATALRTLAKTYTETLDIYVLNRLKDCKEIEDDREPQALLALFDDGCHCKEIEDDRELQGAAGSCRELQEAGKAAEALGNMSERMTVFTRKLALRIKMQNLENLRRGG